MRAVPVPPNPSTDLGTALRGLRELVAQTRFPLPTPGARKAAETAAALAAQLDDYLIPRVARLDAPVLAVVGGSTGAGKSTLVNSLVRAPVSRTGALRPTTRGPVLVCHPVDVGWFGSRAVLPTLARAGEPSADALQVVAAPKLSAGLALLDAPDIDSVVARNRELARELLAAADLWLFVTTAARYADAVPWDVLRGARDRGTVVAVVLDRVAPAVRDDVAADLGRLLSERGLPGAPLFVVHESALDSHGLLPTDQVAPIETYLSEMAADEVRRRGVTRRSMLGAVAAAAAAADELAWATVEQLTAADTLAGTVRAAYQHALSGVQRHLRDGALLRGEVYTRWRASVASGEVRRALRASQDRSRARPAPAPPGRALHAAITAALVALVEEADRLATEAVAEGWRADPAGRRLLGDGTDDRNRVAASDLVRDWQAWLREEVRSAAPTVRTRARATTSAATVLLATIAAVAPSDPGSDDTLRRILAAGAVARLGEHARAGLLDRVEQYLNAGAGRWRERVEDLQLDAALVARLRAAAAEVGVARQLSRGLGRAA